MRRLLNTLFVLTEDSYLSLDGENVVISQEKKEVGRFPLHTLESILCFSYPGASPALMGACSERGVDLAFFSPQGKFLARVVTLDRVLSCFASSSTARRTIPLPAAGTPKDFCSARSTTLAGYWSGQPATIPSASRWKS